MEMWCSVVLFFIWPFLSWQNVDPFHQLFSKLLHLSNHYLEVITFTSTAIWDWSTVFWSNKRNGLYEWFYRPYLDHPHVCFLNALRAILDLPWYIPACALILLQEHFRDHSKNIFPCGLRVVSELFLGVVLERSPRVLSERSSGVLSEHSPVWSKSALRVL